MLEKNETFMQLDFSEEMKKTAQPVRLCLKGE